MAGTWTQGQPSHTFVVALLSVADNVGTGLFDGSSSASRLLYISGHGSTNASAGSARGISSPGDAWARIEVGWNGASSRMRVNDLAAIGPVNLGAGAPGGITLGCKGDISDHADGYIAEILDYGRILSVAEQTQVHAYLATRYGI